LPVPEPLVTVSHEEFAPGTAVHVTFAVTAIWRPLDAEAGTLALAGSIVSVDVELGVHTTWSTRPQSLPDDTL